MRTRIVAGAAVGLLAAAALGGSALAGPAAPAAPKTITVKLSGITMMGKKNAKLQAKLNDSLRFVWVTGKHNVELERKPKGAKPFFTGKPTRTHAPAIYKLAKKGTFFFYCQPHEKLGMTLTATVK